MYNSKVVVWNAVQLLKFCITTLTVDKEKLKTKSCCKVNMMFLIVMCWE